jgi:hypothetical protein
MDQSVKRVLIVLSLSVAIVVAPSPRRKTSSISERIALGGMFECARGSAVIVA